MDGRALNEKHWLLEYKPAAAGHQRVLRACCVGGGCSLHGSVDGGRQLLPLQKGTDQVESVTLQQAQQHARLCVCVWNSGGQRLAAADRLADCAGTRTSSHCARNQGLRASALLVL